MLQREERLAHPDSVQVMILLRFTQHMHTEKKEMIEESSICRAGTGFKQTLEHYSTEEKIPPGVKKLRKRTKLARNLVYVSPY